MMGWTRFIVHIAVFFFSQSESSEICTFFCIESALAGPALQTTPGGVETRFYHHWKGLLKLHAKSLSKFLLLHPSPLVRARTMTKIYGNPAAGGQLCRQDLEESEHDFTTI